MFEQKATVYNVAILGPPSVGKTSAVNQFCVHQFPEAYDPYDDVAKRKQCYIEEELCVLDIVSATGQEEYTAMRESSIKSAEGIMIMYAVTAGRGALEAVDRFLDEVKRVKGAGAAVVLVANKIDVRDRDGAEVGAEDRMVSEEDGRKVAERWGCPFVEISAKEGRNVDDAFHECVREIRNWRRKKEAERKEWEEQKEKDRKMDEEYKARLERKPRKRFSMVLKDALKTGLGRSKSVSASEHRNRR